MNINISFPKLFVASVIFILLVILSYAAYTTHYISWMNVAAIVFIILVGFLVYISTSVISNDKNANGPISVEEARFEIEDYVLQVYKKTIDYNNKVDYHAATQIFHLSGDNYRYFGMIFRFLPDKNREIGEKMHVIWSLDKNELVRIDGMGTTEEDITDPFYNFSPMKIAGNYMRDKKDTVSGGTNIYLGQPAPTDPNQIPQEQRRKDNM